MKLNQPIGDASYAPLFIRCTLGGYFLLAGLIKLDNLGVFIKEIQGMEVLPNHVATLFAIMLPYLEVVAGGLLILGMWTTAAAIVVAVLLGTFIYAIGLFPNRADLFNKDIILLGAALSVMYSGGGAFSVDQFRKNA